MKKLLILSIGMLFLFEACNKPLDLVPLDQITSASLWKDPNLMQAYVNNIYIGLGLGEFNSTSGLSDLSDESMWTNGAKAITQSTITSSNLDVFGGSRFNYLEWGYLYGYIQKCNVFLKNTDGWSGSDPSLVSSMRGEVYFLRGYFYQNLMRSYGGVPLISQVYTLSDSFDVARASFAQTINFIVNDADSAAALLPLTNSTANIGRATEGSALALKSRVLLYAASDLYNLNPSGMPETGYVGATSADRQVRWDSAQAAALAVMNLGIYHLYNKYPDSAAENYEELFLDYPNSEEIFARYTNINAGAPNVGEWFSPNGYDGYGEDSPLEQMVESYEMRDGTKFSWNNPEEAAHPYENRDPRLTASIFYDGTHWRQRPSDAISFDPLGIVQTYKTLTLPDGSTVSGIDTRSGPVENWNGSYTNYYLRKFLDPENDFLSINQEIPWPFLRYAEVLLNYAEASIELGQFQDARNVLNQIRERAGMPDFTSTVTGDSLMEEYRNERKIEMAFEEQRFFDVRRWMIAPQVMNEDAKGIEISVSGTNRWDRSTFHNYQYKVIDVAKRHWDNKMYFLPITLDEMNRNPKLVQNPGY